MARRDLYEDRKGVCQCCKKKIPKDYAHTGHWYPRGHPKRTNQLKDLILLCPDCNKQMGACTPVAAGMIVYDSGDWNGEDWKPSLMDIERVIARKYMRITKHKNALLNSLRGMEVTGQRQVDDVKQLAKICGRLKNHCGRKVERIVKDDPLAPFAEALPRLGLLSLGKILGVLPRRPNKYHNASAFLKCFSGIIDRKTNKVTRGPGSNHSRIAAGVRYQISDNIVRTPSIAEDQRIKEVYNRRKEYERAKLVNERGPGHADMRARGYVADVYLTAIWCVDTGNLLWEGDGIKPPQWEGCPDLSWLQGLVREHSVC